MAFPGLPGGLFGGLFGRKRHERAGYELYTQAVRAARDPHFYADLGVPDTLDGRFDMIGLVVVLLIHRLQADPQGAPVAQAVFDAMFGDMDRTLRELGVSDMSVGKKVKAMWEALHGRAAAYNAALDADDTDALAEAIGRNVWRDHAPAGGPQALAAAAHRLRQSLAGQAMSDLASGRVRFPPALAAA